MAGNIEQQIQNTVLQAAKVVEEQVDSELEKLDRMTTDEMEELREKRLNQLKKYEEQKREWLHKGHGQYNEVPGDKEFLLKQRIAQDLSATSTVTARFGARSSTSTWLSSLPSTLRQSFSRSTPNDAISLLKS